MGKESFRTLGGGTRRVGGLLGVAGMPLRGEGSCGGGGAPRDSAGSGATEEGLTSRGGRNLTPGKSGLHVRGEGERVIALELW